jgi:hypothetical protein
MNEELRKAAEDIRLEALDYHGHAHEYLVKAAAVLTEAAENHDRLTRERDEARAELADAQSALDQAEIAGGFTENGNLWRFWSNKAREYIAKSDEVSRKATAQAEARGFERGVREAAKVAEITIDIFPSKRTMAKTAILALLEPVTLQEPEA